MFCVASGCCGFLRTFRRISIELFSVHSAAGTVMTGVLSGDCQVSACVDGLNSISPEAITAPSQFSEFARYTHSMLGMSSRSLSELRVIASADNRYQPGFGTWM